MCSALEMPLSSRTPRSLTMVAAMRASDGARCACSAGSCTLPDRARDRCSASDDEEIVEEEEEEVGEPIAAAALAAAASAAAASSLKSLRSGEATADENDEDDADDWSAVSLRAPAPKQCWCVVSQMSTWPPSAWPSMRAARFTGGP